MRNGKTCFGVIIGTRAYFNSELARDVRKQLLATLDANGYEYVILPEDATPTGSSSIETREDGLKVSKQFREHRDEIDGIIVSLPNFGFEIGIINAISDADLNVPVMVQACDDDNDKVDLDSRRDAFCGKISVCNNLYQYGIPFTDTSLHTYSIYSPLLLQDINRFAAICRVVNGLRHCRIGQIGTRPLGFNTCRASEKLLQRSGITVVPADLSEILFAAQRISDDDPKFKAMCDRIRHYAEVPEAYNSKLALQAKFGVAVENWIADNDVQAVAISVGIRWSRIMVVQRASPCQCSATNSFLRLAKQTWLALYRCMHSVWHQDKLLPCSTGTTILPTTAISVYVPTAVTSHARLSATTNSGSVLSVCSDAPWARSTPLVRSMRKCRRATSPFSDFPPTIPRAASKPIWARAN